jgi:DNA-directed RNA polymerase subunit M/transcription elongation factor TFIIS
MIICTNCDVIVHKNTFCTDKCRKEYHRKDASVKNEAKKSVATELQKKVTEITQTVINREPNLYQGKTLSGRKATCPVCYEETPIEYAQEHYSKNHGDI